MNEVGAADRTRLLRSKRAELSRIVTSRKRKLLEFLAVCDYVEPIPQIDLSNVDAPPTNLEAARFLDATDILQNRRLDESNLPTRRLLRSDTSRKRSPIRKASPDTRSNDAPRKAAKLQRDGSKSRKSRASTPSSRSDGGLQSASTENNLGNGSSHGVSMQRSSSKGSQTDLPAESAAVLDEIVEESFENATRPEHSMADSVVPAKDLESDRIRTRVESRPNSPGVDPRKAMPISAEDAANLQEPLVEGLGSHDVPHKATTAHLPPREVQERRLHQAEKEHGQRQDSLTIHPPQHGRHPEAASSPGSTNDAQSATTPAMHETSADTSPDNESSRYDVVENKEDVSTPTALKPTPEEIAEKAQHERLMQAQMEVNRAEILKDSPATDPNHLQGEQPQSVEADDSRQDGDNEIEQLTKDADEMVQDIVEDEDEVVGVPTSEEEPTTASQVASRKSQVGESKVAEIPDSEAENTPPVDAMDVDVTTVKDSFESAPAVSEAPASSPVVAEPVESRAVNDSKKSSATPAASTPRRTPTPATPVLERMTTRVASGAMRHKSVSEILGETPKPSNSSGRGTDSDSAGNSHSPSRSTTPQSPGSRVRSIAEKQKEKERSKLSTVIFPGRPPKPAPRDNALVHSGEPESLKDDYFLPLFLASSSTDKKLDSLLATAHKTITTSNAYIPIEENQTTKVLKRIYSLQNSSKWSLRQPKRCPEPIRPTFHWDVMLQEAKWMRTDFREEAKWKRTVARNLAFACAEWVEASLEDRKLLQVKASSPKPLNPETQDTEMGEASSHAAHPTPDLVASGESDSQLDDFDEEPRLNLLETVAPTAIFGLQYDDVVFGLNRSPLTDKLLDELPIYGAPLQVPKMPDDLPTSEIDPDRFWKRPALPLSKYVEGRMELKWEGPPRKKSRYHYDEEDDDEDQVVFGEQLTKKPILPPESADVALFNPDHKHIRDRIHSSHQFRPPSEFPMPLQSFFECRIASQWTADEDMELKGLVRDYSYNWSLISTMLSTKSLFAAGPERRTPWECFERWIHLEGLPADMQKTHYFRAYTTRIDAANRSVAQQAQAQQQQNAAGQMQPMPRKRPTTSVRVERRRNSKHLTLVESMRKLAKKRETSLQKQQHAAGMAAMRKANEAPHPANRNMPATTPQDFSRIKFEREEQFKERLAELQRRQEAQRRAVLLQQRNLQNPQQPGVPNGAPPRPPTGAVMPNGPQPNNQNLTVPGQNRPRPMPPQMPGQPMQNGLRPPQMGMNGVPAAQMQGQLPLPNPALDVGLVTRAHQISQHQQAILRQQQGLPGQSPQMHNSPPRMNGMPQPGFAMPPNMMPPFNSNPNGISTPPPNHAQSPIQGQAGSPRMGQNTTGLSHVQHLEQMYKQKYPGATPDQITRLISEHLAKSVQQQQAQAVQQHQQRQGLAQSAMNAAAGSPVNGAPGIPGMPGMNSIGGSSSTPQLYAQILRQQQENQSKQSQAAAQASKTVANAQGQENRVVNGNGTGNGNAGQGHAHRNSSGSVQSST